MQVLPAGVAESSRNWSVRTPANFQGLELKRLSLHGPALSFRDVLQVCVDVEAKMLCLPSVYLAVTVWKPTLTPCSGSSNTLRLPCYSSPSPPPCSSSSSFLLLRLLLGPPPSPSSSSSASSLLLLLLRLLPPPLPPPQSMVSTATIAAVTAHATTATATTISTLSVLPLCTPETALNV